MFVKWEISAVDILSIPGCILLEEKSQRGMDLHRKLLNVSPDKKNPGDKRALTGDLGLKYECEDIFQTCPLQNLILWIGCICQVN